jgi:hypothetical protein
MAPNSNSSSDVVRRALLKIDDDVVLAAVDSLDLRSSAKISAVVGFPLRTLQQRRDVTAFAVSAPLPAVAGVLELLAIAPQEKIVVLLGDHADSPSYEQLSVALDEMATDGSSTDELVALLAFAVSEKFPAAGHCHRLLEERPELELPALPEVESGAKLLSPRETDPEVREQRRARREQERQRKKGPVSSRPSRPPKTKTRGVVEAPGSSVSTSSREPVAPLDRRRYLFTPLEIERFDTGHPLVGTVVLVEVPFDAIDPTTPELTSKSRPALVVAANDDTVLIRPIYSNPGSTRSLFQPWRRLGLDHVSYIDDARMMVGVSSDAPLVRKGQLTDVEWNALL